jgi:hypothetical protein
MATTADEDPTARPQNPRVVSAAPDRAPVTPETSYYGILVTLVEGLERVARELRQGPQAVPRPQAPVAGPSRAGPARPPAALRLVHPRATETDPGTVSQP